MWRRGIGAVFVLACAFALLASVSSSARNYDCSDFATQPEAQRAYEEAGPGDPHHLDGDGR